MALEKITIPDFGDVQEITVVEVYVKAGDQVSEEDPLVALESEKAVMDIPSPFTGVIKEVKLAEGDSVKNDDVIAIIEIDGAAESTEAEADQQPPEPSRQEPEAETTPEPAQATDTKEEAPEAGPPPHASPSVRAHARTQGVDLSSVEGSGPKGRILKEDVDKQVGAKKQSAGQPVKPAEKPLEDFSAHGETEEIDLGRIKKISAEHLHNSWVTIPHVTHFDEADITELDSFRHQLNERRGEDDIKLSPLIFVIKATVATLKAYPLFNCSLVPGTATVIAKKYYHLGIAVDTPSGLVVPVIKHADRKGIYEIGDELRSLSTRAREGKLTIPDIQGATFTISSLGGIGGTGFTPIISSPQSAILGLSRSYHKPVWDGEAFIPRLTLPFSVSYDHRIIDGAEAARFCQALAANLEDLRRALL
ncbi:MAG: 2-oxo acid dehydrogenase subunit E2 [Desulfofustis sp. PB-SRB1]|jgi:pyruvate dehydrogenase E2 component (dihydrolipoamide acetyltransferase)|nr:2-oxo acid dehydrogenase subunit E2 [Desulfofustis sp. PB-SRB1]MBM1002597.1 2-oxo acid dehydrogenase subunit E2 [Desulfofustis sp. PB-SRB1]HBH30217.1 branched-chain alpha-keto acid dehydrogenase subunit E2 [Desulfofustis sp.]HBH32020.1 branched-chain alpha-keto acid dehydrogenase subunit E2 [Desulfofustis sp.]